MSLTYGLVFFTDLRILSIFQSILYYKQSEFLFPNFFEPFNLTFWSNCLQSKIISQLKEYWNLIKTSMLLQIITIMIYS